MSMNRLISIITPALLAFAANAAMYENPDNHHFYEVVKADPFTSYHPTWDAANADAKARTYAGLAGHLATIRSAGEEAFVESILPGYGATTWIPSLYGSAYWLGGYQDPITETDPKAGWTWVNHEGQFPGDNAGPVYAHWQSNCPGDNNTWYGLQQYLTISTITWTFGNWVDAANGDPNTDGYVVEYEASAVPEAGTWVAGLAALAGFALVTLRRCSHQVPR